MLNWERLSTVSKIASVLLIIAIVGDILGFLGLIFGAATFSMMGFDKIFEGVVSGFLAFIVLIGFALNLFALSAVKNGNVKQAGILSIFASFVPPLDIIGLVAGILFLVDKEGVKPVINNKVKPSAQKSAVPKPPKPAKTVVAKAKTKKSVKKPVKKTSKKK